MTPAVQRPVAALTQRQTRTGVEKAVLMLLTLGQPKSGELLRMLNKRDIELLMFAAREMKGISTDELSTIVGEFENSFRQSARLQSTPSEFRDVLSQLMSDADAAEVTPEIPSAAPVPIWTQLAEVKTEVLGSYLSSQHPQIGAFVLFRLGSERASEIIKDYPAGLRSELLCRMLDLDEIPQDSESALEAVLRDDLLGAKQERKGQHSAIAGIINNLDRDQLDEILSYLRTERPNDVPELQKLLFRFEDLNTLPAKALTMIMESVPVERTVLALQGLDSKFQSEILAALSPRMRRMAESELQNGVSAPTRDVAQARRMIVESVLKLPMEVRGPQAADPTAPTRG